MTLWNHWFALRVRAVALASSAVSRAGAASAAEHDAFTKDGEVVTVKVVWRALVEERGA